MAPPPRYLITRKLIKRFFDGYLPTTPIQAEEEMAKMYDCWKRHGIESKNCREFEELFDQMKDRVQEYRKKLDALRLKQTVKSQLGKPLYHYDVKGRYRQELYHRNPMSAPANAAMKTVISPEFGIYMMFR